MHMLLRKIFKISFLALAFVFFNFAANEANAFETKAKQAILMDFATGKILFAKNADEKMGPSSMTKIMTSYLIFDALKNEEFDLDSRFDVSKNAWKTEGSRMFLEPNQSVSLSDLIQGIVVQSGNDACVVIAEGFSGTVEGFAIEMNEKAKKLKLENTSFANPHGLTNEKHYTTARDLAILSKSLVETHPEFYHYFSQKDFTYNKIRQSNRNFLIGSGLGVDGLKTGHTDAAGYGIVVSAAKRGSRLIGVVNGLKSSRGRIEEARKLLSYGFTNFKNMKLYDKGEIVTTIEVWGGKKNKVAAITKDEIEILTERRSKSRKKTELKVKYNQPLFAPIEEGVEVAKLQIFEDDELVTETPLYAENKVKKAGLIKELKDKIKFLIREKL